MIVDSSAIVALLKREAQWDEVAQALETSQERSISAGTYLEVGIVVDSWKDPLLSSSLDELLERFQIVVEPVTAEQTHIARQAYRDYGKGSGHPARLNFGDCFSYALARVKREAILFKGTDFQLTDLHSALA